MYESILWALYTQINDEGLTHDWEALWYAIYLQAPLKAVRFHSKPKVLRTCMENIGVLGPGPSLKVWFSLNEFPTFKNLVPNWWPCLGSYKRCGLAGGNMSLRTGFEISKATSHSQCSPSRSQFETEALGLLFQPPRLLVCHALPSGLLPLCQVTRSWWTA